MNEQAGKAALESDFRLAMRRLASAVCVVARQGRDGWLGMSATSVTSLSMEPPSLLICANRSARLSEDIAEGMVFSANILNGDQSEISRIFGDPSCKDQRFVDGGWFADDAGVPIMGEALAAISCRIARLMAYGSHYVVIGEVLAVHLNEGGEPLIYCDGVYR